MPNKRKSISPPRSISPRNIVPSPALSTLSTTSSINNYATELLDNKKNHPLYASRQEMSEDLPTQEELKIIHDGFNNEFKKNKKGGKKKKRKTTKKNKNKRKYTIRRRRR